MIFRQKIKLSSLISAYIANKYHDNHNKCQKLFYRMNLVQRDIVINAQLHFKVLVSLCSFDNIYQCKS